MTQTYTAFCQQANGEGTIWIDSVEADDLEEAIFKAQVKCSSDWGVESYAPEDIHVLGLAEGTLNIVYWSDICDN